MASGEAKAKGEAEIAEQAAGKAELCFKRLRENPAAPAASSSQHPEQE